MKTADAIAQQEDGHADAQQRTAGLQHAGDFRTTAELAEAPERAHEQGVGKNLVEEHGQLRAVEAQGLNERILKTGTEALHVIREVGQDVDEQQNQRTHEEVRDEVARHVAIHGSHEGIEHRPDKGLSKNRPIHIWVNDFETKVQKQLSGERMVFLQKVLEHHLPKRKKKLNVCLVSFIKIN